MGINSVVAWGLRLKGRALAAAICGGVLAAGAGTSTVVLGNNAAAVRATVDPGHSTSKSNQHASQAQRYLSNLEKLALKTTAQQLGLTPKQLRQQLPGKSLAQVAGDKAQSVQDAIYAAFKLKLDAAVTAGKLKSETETKLLSTLGQRLPNVMNHVFPAKHTSKGGIHKHTGSAALVSPGPSPFLNTSSI